MDIRKYLQLLIIVFFFLTPPSFSHETIEGRFLKNGVEIWPFANADLNRDQMGDPYDNFPLSRYEGESHIAHPNVTAPLYPPRRSDSTVALLNNFSLATTPTPTPTFVPNIDLSLEVNAAAFGAQENDDVVDLDAIQDAIDFVATQGGGIVNLNPGIFLIQSRDASSKGSIQLKDHVALIGAGIGVTTIQLINNDHQSINGLVRTLSNHANKNCVLQDLTLDGNRQNNSGRVIGFYCGTSPDSQESDEDIQCIRVEIKNCLSYGFDPHERTTRLSLIDCLSHDNGMDGFTVDYGIDSVLRGCMAWNNDRHGFNIVTDSNHVQIIECESYDNAGNGLMIQNGSHHLTLLNNMFHHNASNGIAIRGSNSIWVEGCAISENVTEGILVRGSEDVYIFNNFLINNGLGGNYHDIKLDNFNEIGTRYCQIYNNQIFSMGEPHTLYGIYEKSDRQDFNILTQNRIDGQRKGSVFISGPNSRDSF